MTDDLRFTSDPADIDAALVHRWLSEQSYWAEGRTREVNDRAMAASRNYAVLDGAGRQLGYARVITDGATSAWLADVFVDAEARGRGVGKLLIGGVVADLDPLGLKRIALRTADAHGLYAQFGFEPLTEPELWMQRLPR